MSQDLHVCSIDLTTFRDVHGSGNRRILKLIVSKRRSDIESYDWYFSRSDPVAKPLANVIEEVIFGRLDPTTPRWQYEGAVAVIGDALGTPLVVNVLTEVKPALSIEVDSLIVALRRRKRVAGSTWPSIAEILRRGPPLNVPLDPKLRLGMGFLTAREVNVAQNAVCGDFLRETVPAVRLKLKWPLMAQDAVAEYIEWLRCAKLQKQGLFLHR